MNYLIDINNNIENYYSNTFRSVEDIPIQENIKIIKKGKKKKRKQRKYENRVPRKYNIYIKSKFWIERKNAYWKKYKKQCCVCGSFKFVDLHHGKYAHEYYGKEKDEWLFPFCRECHTDFHTTIKTKADMLGETLNYIEENYQPHDSFNC